MNHWTLRAAHMRLLGFHEHTCSSATFEALIEKKICSLCFHTEASSTRWRPRALSDVRTPRRPQNTKDGFGSDHSHHWDHCCWLLFLRISFRFISFSSCPAVCMTHRPIRDGWTHCRESNIKSTS